jgi:hypothetical protein
MDTYLVGGVVGGPEAKRVLVAKRGRLSPTLPLPSNANMRAPTLSLSLIPSSFALPSKYTWYMF